MLRPIFITLFVCGLFLAPILPVYGGPAPTPAPSPSANAPAPPEEKIDEDSPRASLSEYLAACNRGQYARAAEFLELMPNDSARGPALARMLKAVLDRHLSIDLEAVSADSVGHKTDTLAPNTEELGKIGRPNGKLEPVRLVRRQRDNTDVWLFSRTTVQHIDDWYKDLPHRWMLDHL